jgi:4-amino-4-deoxy-L-arabinose transferase-like glycosyltransferase
MTAVTAARPAVAGAHAASRRPRAERLALTALLTATAVLYIVGLSRNGWANDFYAAAVQAGTKSWKAFFFGSFDAASFITVDKTPASLWVMELSGRLFGLNSWSMLVPQALEGVASVGLLYAAVRRWHGAAAGLLAGAALALTPVAALMFRFNNPDALLTLLLTAGAYGMVRAVESGRTRWLVLAGTLLGFGFLTKMLQAFLLLPAFGLVYLVAGPRRLPVRLAQLAAGLGAVLVSAGWWVAAVMLTPAADRPYVGGSTNDSILQLALGYNGLGRLDGNETGSVGFTGGHGGSPSFSGAAGFGRLFAADMGGQISWLLPAALIFTAGLIWLSWRARRGPAAVTPAGARLDGYRRDRDLAAVLLWGGWLAVTGVVFSFMQGIIHPYYTIALAPAIAALAGIGATRLWRAGRLGGARGLLAAGIAATAVWSYLLLNRTPDWLPPLRFAVLVLGLAAAAAVLVADRLGVISAQPDGGPAGRRGPGAVIAGVALTAALAGPLAYTLDTIDSTHTGALPTAGPATTAGFGGPGGGTGPAGFTPGGSRSAGTGTGGFAGPGGSSGTGRTGGSARSGGLHSAGGTRPSGLGGTGHAGSGGQPGGGIGGGLGGSTTVSSTLVRLLEQDGSAYTWVAATVGSESAAPLQLATRLPVMSIGGFNGTDPAPSLAEFERLVSEHKIHYFVGANSDSFGGGSGDASAITRWVAAHFRSQTVGGVRVYNLTESLAG